VRSGKLKFAAIVACLVLASLPPLGFVQYLERHAANSAQETLRGYADRMVDHLELIIDEGVLALTDLYEQGATKCNQQAIDSMRRAIFDAYVLREIAIVDQDGRVVCADTIFKTERWTLSRLYTVNDKIDVSVVVDEQTLLRSLALRYQPEEGRTIVAHFAPNSLGLDVLPDRWRSAGGARLNLLDGTEFQRMPRPTSFEVGGSEMVSSESDGGDPDRAVIDADAVSNRYPLAVEVQVDRDTVMRDFQNLKIYGLIVMTVYASVVLGGAVFIARQKPTPSDDIARGLRRHEFLPYYQPVINLMTGQLEGCEVLIRRRRHDGSIEVPAAFIAQAESDGQIVPMTNQLMRSVRADLGVVYQSRPQLSVAFNLCAKHFTDDQIVHDAEAIFGESQIDLKQVIFEVTERLPLPDTATAVKVIDQLQDLGAMVALDDAGTGHSGLATLQRLGMDIVKIDKLFIDQIGPDTQQAPIVDSLVDLAKKFSMSVIAEGVETMDQVNYLRARGVDFAQGYLFAPPLPASSFITLIEAMASEKDADAEQEADVAA